ncbi:MAG: c-type cytochrome [Oligoflexales bacterium]|nr:c-type cytochrome [Oligoflexales bacterium]
MKILLFLSSLLFACQSHYEEPSSGYELGHRHESRHGRGPGHGFGPGWKPMQYRSKPMMHGWRFEKQKGPKLADADSANGKKLYTQHCQQCHGVSGKGDGVAAKDMETKPADLSSNSFHHKRHFFFFISEGTNTGMPAWKSVLSQKEIFDLIAYIKTL